MKLRDMGLADLFDRLPYDQQKVFEELDYHMMSIRDYIIQYLTNLSEFEKIVLGIDETGT
jgi:hypothetical protein